MAIVFFLFTTFHCCYDAAAMLPAYIADIEMLMFSSITPAAYVADC